MPKKPYRVEVTYPKTGKPKYFLVKDIRVGKYKRKIKKYLGIFPPTTADKARYSQKYAYEIELRAVKKRAELSSTLYRSKYLDREQLKHIEEIKYVYKTFKEHLTINEIEVYEQDFEVNYVQGTTSIEGNTFTVTQTYDLLVNGVIPNDKPLREINEVQNFKLVKIYRDKYTGKINLNFIRTLHSLIMNNIDMESAGTFRRFDHVGITGCDIAITPAILIEEELKRIIDEYYQKLDEGRHPFEEIVMFHYFFEIIHPFADGNGRVGREILNCMFSRIGYPRLLFLGSDRETYIESLRLGNKENYTEMIEIFKELIMKQRLELLLDNLKKVVIPPIKKGQLRLSDYFVSEDKESTISTIHQESQPSVQRSTET